MLRLEKIMATITGDSDDNVLSGTSDDDVITGQGGDDTIYAGDGQDYVDGGAGDDKIYGGGDNDNLNGGDDADTFIINSIGSSGNTAVSINGGSGGDDDDTLNIADLINNQGYVIQAANQNGDSDGNGYTGNIILTNATTGDYLNINYNNIENFVLCFTPGSLICTPRGDIPVETLSVGDKVITRDNGAQEIRWIGEKPLSQADFQVHEQLTPVFIQKGALGNDVPARDMMVSPQHRVLIESERAALFFDESEVLVPAVQLVGMPGISRVAPLRTSYIHFMCDRHEVVKSDDLWSETFQPGLKSMNSLQSAQREEVFHLFSELRDLRTLENYPAVRKTLKRYETQVLMAQ
jgi:hypothetical protein